MCCSTPSNSFFAPAVRYNFGPLVSNLGLLPHDDSCTFPVFLKESFTILITRTYWSVRAVQRRRLKTSLKSFRARWGPSGRLNRLGWDEISCVVPLLLSSVISMVPRFYSLNTEIIRKLVQTPKNITSTFITTSFDLLVLLNSFCAITNVIRIHLGVIKEGGVHPKAVFWLGITVLTQTSRSIFKQSKISMLISHIYVSDFCVNLLVIFGYVWR